MSVNTYYFDVSVSGPTDPDSVFTDDGNAFDGSTSTYSTTDTIGSKTSNYLQGNGTDASGSDTISQVRARLYATSGSGTRSATIYTSSNQDIGTAEQTVSAASWGDYVVLNTPTGGWDWTKAASLYVRMYGSDVTFTNFFYRVEIEVTHSTVAADITYNESGVTYSSSTYQYNGQSIAQQFDRAISSVIGLTDSLDYAAVMAIGIQDAIGITDGLLRTHSVIRTLTEQEGITDFLDKNSAYIRTTIDNEGITDSLNYILSIQRSLQDALGLTDVIKYNFTLNRFLEDSEGLTDNLDRVSSYVKEIVDSIGLTDVLNKISSQGRSLEDSEGLTDSLVASLTKLISIGDSVGISDVLNKVSQMPRDISDSEGLTDLLDAKITILRAILDNEGITDNLDAIKKIIINISDDVGISDAIGVLTRGIDQTIAQIWDIDDTKPVMMSVSMNKSDLKIVINEKPSYDSIGKTLAVFQSTSTIYDDPLTDYDSATQVYGGPDPRQEIGKTPATVSVYKPEIISVGGL